MNVLVLNAGSAWLKFEVIAARPEDVALREQHKPLEGSFCAHQFRPHGLTQAAFDELFTPDKAVIFNFHGYPVAVKKLLFERTALGRSIAYLPVAFYNIQTWHSLCSLSPSDLEVFAEQIYKFEIGS